MPCFPSTINPKAASVKGLLIRRSITANKRRAPSISHSVRNGWETSNPMRAAPSPGWPILADHFPSQAHNQSMNTLSSRVVLSPSVPSPLVPSPSVPSPLVPSPLVPSPLVPSPSVPSPLVPSPLVPSPSVPSPSVPSPLVPSPLVPSPLVPSPSVPGPCFLYGLTPHPPPVEIPRYFAWFLSQDACYQSVHFSFC